MTGGGPQGAGAPHPDPWRPPRPDASRASDPRGERPPWTTPGGWAPTPGADQGGWTSPGSPWGGSVPDQPSAPPPRKRRRGLIIVAVVLVVGLIVLAVGLTASALGPRFTGTNVLDASAVERGVAQVVTQDWKRKVDGVRCPADRPARAGTSFSCSATVDGRPQQVPVDVLDERGLYQVGQPR